PRGRRAGRGRDALHVRRARPRRRARAVPVRAVGAARAARVVRDRVPARGDPRGARLHDGIVGRMRVSPFVRNFAVLVLIALAIWALSLESALVTASMLVRVAFILAIALVAYLLW